MKKILLIVGLALGGAAPSHAAVDTLELGISSATIPQAISVSTSAYTNVTPAASKTLAPGITAVLVDNPSTNTGTMHGHIGNCTSTAVSISTVKGPIEIPPSASGGYFRLAFDECLWLVSRHTSAESVTVQGITERP